MKSIRVKFIGTLLIIAIVILSGATYQVFKFSNIMAENLSMFMNMKYPMLFLCEGIIVALIIAIVFGLLALLKYGKDKIFEKEMLFDLQLTSLSFSEYFSFQYLQ